MKKIFALGSSSSIKLNALSQVCANLDLKVDIKAFETESGQNEQPVGLNETYNGALNRAHSALSQYSEASAAIGIENGIFYLGENLPILDFACIAILTPDGKHFITTTPAVEFPKEYVEEANKRNFTTTTVGSVIAEKLGGNSTDPHSTLTRGRISRLETLIAGLTIAIKQIL